ncbi:MAG: type II restriction endonuclease [Gemmataceae bacterium]
MTHDDFLSKLQTHSTKFAKAVATNEGDWIVKGFIDIYRKIYTVSVDTKIVSKVLELLLFPMFVEFAKEHSLTLDLCPQQNFYPDLTFTDKQTAAKYAVDIKSTYRFDERRVNGMTLGAFTGYFRNRESSKNTLYPYGQYSGHFVLGVIYSQSQVAIDERKSYTLDYLELIPSVIRDFQFFAQPKYRIAAARPGSGNTKNIGSITAIADLLSGSGPFAQLGEEIYDDYWMYYLTKDMAQALGIQRPYTNLKSYAEYKHRGIEKIEAHREEIEKLAEEDEQVGDQEEPQENE